METTQFRSNPIMEKAGESPDQVVSDGGEGACHGYEGVNIMGTKAPGKERVRL